MHNSFLVADRLLKVMIVSYMFLKYQNCVDAELGTKQKKKKQKKYYELITTTTAKSKHN